jgi:hypothetical protein
MCGSSKSTAAPAPSPPTTFGYGVADSSNVSKPKAAAVGDTRGSTALTQASNDGPAGAGVATMGG